MHINSFDEIVFQPHYGDPNGVAANCQGISIINCKGSYGYPDKYEVMGLDGEITGWFDEQGVVDFINKELGQGTSNG
jgi:hypothetical protein